MKRTQSSHFWSQHSITPLRWTDFLSVAPSHLAPALTLSSAVISQIGKQQSKAENLIVILIAEIDLYLTLASDYTWHMTWWQSETKWGTDFSGRQRYWLRAFQHWLILLLWWQRSQQITALTLALRSPQSLSHSQALLPSI